MNPSIAKLIESEDLKSKEQLSLEDSDEIILIPINVNNSHWVLSIIDLKLKLYIS
jgi:Ulp1 family protease